MTGKNDSLRVFTRDELERATGTDGNAALVVFDGKVYDVTASEKWRGGVHFRTHKAGQDLTDAIGAAPHGAEVFERFEPIGLFAEAKAPEKQVGVAAQPVLIDKLLAFHPHPMSVHFPIALSIVGAFFMFLYLVFRNASFEMFSLYCIILAALAAPVSITTGALSWRYNYGGVWTRIYRWKASLSAVLVILQIAALVTRLGLVSGPDLASPIYWLYVLPALAMAPTVMGLGYFGGKITFPS